MSEKTMVELLRELLASVDINAGWDEAAENAADARARELDAIAAAARSSRVLTCAFCAQEYPQDTLAAGSQVLVDHIRVCPAHPMRAIEQRRDRLVSAVLEFVGADNLDHLRNMIECVEKAGGGDPDAQTAANLMRALALELELQKAEVQA